MPAFWQPRYYDFNVFRERKHIEKQRYMDRNPGPQRARFWLAGVEAGEARLGGVAGVVAME